MKNIFLKFYFPLLLLIIACSRNKDYLPSNFFEMSLENKFRGSVAKDYVDNLHFQNVASDSSEIGFYRGLKGNAVVYISYYETEAAAAADEKKMTEKISPENSLFVMGQHIDFEGRNIYRTFGMGQTHYVFTSGNELIWISLGTLWAENFLKEYLTYLEQ